MLQKKLKIINIFQRQLTCKVEQIAQELLSFLSITTYVKNIINVLF